MGRLRGLEMPVVLRHALLITKMAWKNVVGEQASDLFPDKTTFTL